MVDKKGATGPLFYLGRLFKALDHIKSLKSRIASPILKTHIYQGLFLK